MSRSRRGLLRRGAAAIAVGALGTLAGCREGPRSPGDPASGGSPNGTNGRPTAGSPATGREPWYAQWLPATEAAEGGHWGVTAVETARLRPHQDELQTSVRFALEGNGESGGHRIDRTAYISPTEGPGAFEVHRGAFGPADALTAIMGETEKTELETRGGFSIWTSVDEPTLACAVKDGTVVHTLDLEGWDGTAWLRAAIDARRGEAPTAGERDEYAAALTGALGSADLVQGRRADLNPETRYLAFGGAQTIGTDVVTQRLVVVFESAGAVSRNARHRYLDARWNDWRSADPTVETSGNVVTVEASIERDAFDRRDLIVPTP